jgi:hypothetical protein
MRKGIAAYQPPHGSAEHGRLAQLELTVDLFAHLVERLEGQPLRGAPQMDALPVTAAVQALRVVQSVPDRHDAKGCGRRHGDLLHVLDEDLVVLLPGAVE